MHVYNHYDSLMSYLKRLWKIRNYNKYHLSNAIIVRNVSDFRNFTKRIFITIKIEICRACNTITSFSSKMSLGKCIWCSREVGQLKTFYESASEGWTVFSIYEETLQKFMDSIWYQNFILFHKYLVKWMKRKWVNFFCEQTIWYLRKLLEKFYIATWM